MITGIFHAGFVVQDLQRSIAWYRDKLGLEVVYHVKSNGEGFARMTGLAPKPVEMVYLRAPNGGHIELHCFGESATPPARLSPDQTNATHVSFYCDDVAKTVAELEAKGVEMLRPMIVAPSGRRAVYFRDPDGNLLELVDPIER